MKKLITLLALVVGVSISSQAASLTLVSSAAANAGTNMVFSNAVVLVSVTVNNAGGTNLNWTLFNSGVRSNQYSITAYTNYSYATGFVTNQFTNFNTGTLGSNIYTAILKTTNIVAATTRTYPIILGPLTLMTNQTSVTYPINQYLSHGLVITNNQQAAGVVSWTFNYLTTSQ